MKNGTAKGSEIEILKDFARTNKLHIQFKEGSESDLIDKLKKYEIHIVAGGFEKKTLWKQEAGPTVTYDSKHLFLIPKGENRLLQKLEMQIFESKKK